MTNLQVIVISLSIIVAALIMGAFQRYSLQSDGVVLDRLTGSARYMQGDQFMKVKDVKP